MWDKDSLSSIIEYSDVFKKYFANMTKKAHNEGDLQGVRVRNLGLARHRFESTQKPLSRLVLWFDAAVATALYIMRERRSGSREHKAAKRFLQFVDAERLIQAAMMCDGGDESLMLLRLCDDPDLDMATAPDEIAAYIARVEFLFLQGGCLSTRGYTKQVIDMLRNHVITYQVDTAWKSLGGCHGVSQQAIQNCLARMGCWVRVAKSVLDAEFPAFELLQSFSIFTAAAKVSAHLCPSAFVASNQRHFDRLARTFNVDAAALASQFIDHVFIAKQSMASSPGMTLRDAWKTAIMRSQTKSTTRANHPVTALKPVVLRYLVYLASTTAIEHGFAKRLRVLKPQQHMSDDAERDLIKLILDCDLVKDPDTITLAQRQWACQFGTACPARTHHYISKGVPCTKRSTKPSEAEFQRKRRRDVHTAVAGGLPGVMQVDSSTSWCESLQKELDFQKKKLKQRRIEAYCDGLLLPDEIDAGLQDAADKARADAVKSAHDRHVKELRAARREAVPLPSEWFAQKLVFVEPGAADDDDAKAAIQTLRMTVASDRIHADVMLVVDLEDMSKRSLWAAVLKGMYVTTLAGLRGRGAAVKYEAALASKRHVWISPAFRAKHPMVVNMLGVFLQGVPNVKIKWKCKDCDDVQDFTRKIARDRDLIGLVEKSDKQDVA